MAQNFQELCALLVEDACGTTCSQIFSLLASKGRLSRTQLQRHSHIPARQLKHALATLTQQHLLRYSPTAEDSYAPTHYQVDWRNAYCLIRSHRMIFIVEERYGAAAGKVIANLLQLGHAKVEDLASAFDFTSKDINGNAEVNGTGQSHQQKTRDDHITVAQFHYTLRILLQAGFLVKFNKRAYMPAADLQAELEEAVISEHFPDRKINGAKKQTEFKAAVNNLKRKWNAASEYSERQDSDSRGVIRRPDQHVAKRTRINGGLTNGIGLGNDLDDENVAKLSNDLVLRINFAQCTLAYRTQRLVQLAEPYLGGVTATVYGALLQVLESKLRARDDEAKNDEDPDEEEENLPTATVAEVAGILDPTLNLRLGIFTNSGSGDTLPNGESKGKKKATINSEFEDIGIKVEEDSDGDYHMNDYPFTDPIQRLQLIDDHLRLLEEHPKGFCRRVGGGGHGEWRVYFAEMTNRLIDADIDATVLARFGKVHTRMIRLLRERGRLEEKQVAALTIMRVKDVRAVLTELQYAGIVEGQEVPRDNTRQPTRTTYLWFHDQPRVQNLLLQQTYQAMSRTIQRLRIQRVEYKDTLEKVETLGLTQQQLSGPEAKNMTEWRALQEKCMVQVQRMDELVALFRDFSGKDTSMLS